MRAQAFGSAMALRDTRAVVGAPGAYGDDGRVAVFDLDKIDGFIEVRPAEGGERYLSFQEEIEYPEPGEGIFVDGSGHAHARRWTFRQSRRSVVVPSTEKVLIVSEGVHDRAAVDVPSLLDALSGAIGDLWETPVTRGVLTAAQPRLEFDV